MEMFRKTFAEINLDHLKFNLGEIRRNFPNEFICPMVKANGYGHGDVAIAKCLEHLGVQSLGVCLIEEGLLLRNFGVRTRILVFRGFDREGAKKILQYNMTPVVSTWSHLQHLEAVAEQPVAVHVKFNTGMNRLGFPLGEAQRLFDYFWQNKKIRLEAILTHLSQGEDGFHDQGDTVDQLMKFAEVVQIFKALNVHVHALNSAGILSAIKVREDIKKDHPLAKMTWGLRPGLMLYGCNPIQEDFALSLKPVMTLKSVCSVFQNVRKGDGVSYNSTWRAPQNSVIAVVPIGYADGYHRILSNRAEALFMNRRVPVVGSVCMDYLMLDVTAVAAEIQFDPHREHEVIMFGINEESSQIAIQELAQKAQTIPWEILTSVGERVPRVYRGKTSQIVSSELGLS